jgi:predicted lysophospholipase L1 biosynthesis ABC-type transport system permease subunit
LFRTPRLSVRVVGISRTAADVNNRSSDISVSVLSGEFFQRHRSAIAWTPVLNIRLRPGASPESFVAAVRKALPEGVDANFDLINASATFDAVNVLTTGLWLFALVAGLAGAFAVGQAVARQVRSADEERAVLAGLGATRRTLLAEALAPVGLAMLLGIGVALLGTYFASVLMPIGFARRVDPRLGRELDWAVFAVGVVVCSALVIGATGVAVRSARRRVRPRSARSLPAVLANMSPSAMVGLRHASSPGHGSRAVPVRSAFVGVAAATAGIIGVLGFSAGLAHLIDTPSLYGWNFDAVGVPNQYAARVTHDPGVSAVAVVHAGVALRVKGRPALGFVIEPIMGEIRPAIVAGRAPVAIDEVALGADTLDAGHVHIGDAVVIEGAKRKRTMRVVGQGVFPTQADAYPLADGVYLTPAALRDIGEGEPNTTLAFRFRPGTDRAATIARLHAIYAKSDPGADPPDLPAPPAEIEKLRQVESLPKVLAGFLALLGAIALAHALVVGVRRRAGAFAVLRAIGFRQRQVRAAVAWEAGLLAFVGAAIGIPVGIVIARFAWARTARGVGVAVVDRVPVGVMLALAPVAVILAIAVALVPARRAAKLRPAEILRTE